MNQYELNLSDKKRIIIMAQWMSETIDIDGECRLITPESYIIEATCLYLLAIGKMQYNNVEFDGVALGKKLLKDYKKGKFEKVRF